VTAPLRLTAVGDLSFEGPQADRPDFHSLAAVSPLFRQASLAIGNLECVLTREGTAVPGKCTLRGSPAWAAVLKEAGIGLVSLANNHAMDYGTAGLASTRRALREAGIHAVGAGANRREACAPLFLEIGGRRVAFLARTSVIVSSPSYAGEEQPGVAWFDPCETEAAIAACGARADLVVLLAHWGVEEYAYPAPSQRAAAARCIDAGADLILGHHPHVLQGIERRGAGLIVHSLGNFVFDEFDWTCHTPDGPVTERAILSPANREGIVATVEWREPAAAPAFEATCTSVDERGWLRLDDNQPRQTEFARLSAALGSPFYRYWWRGYALHREWVLRLRGQIAAGHVARRLHRLRPHHLKTLMTLLRRSGRLVTQTSTNPYE
jgi:capsule synthesis protein PGA_cap